MPLSTDVRLPRDHEPVFPDCCIRCGAEHPGAFHRVTTHSIGWWTLAFWAFGKRFRVDVPACEGCRRQLKRQRAVRVLVISGLAVVGIAAANWLLFAYRGPFKKWLVLGAAMLFAAPAFAWEALDPRLFDVTALGKSVTYEFRDPEYAEEFLRLNEGGGVVIEEF